MILRKKHIFIIMHSWIIGKYFPLQTLSWFKADMFVNLANFALYKSISALNNQRSQPTMIYKKDIPASIQDVSLLIQQKINLIKITPLFLLFCIYNEWCNVVPHTKIYQCMKKKMTFLYIAKLSTCSDKKYANMNLF